MTGKGNFLKAIGAMKTEWALQATQQRQRKEKKVKSTSTGSPANAAFGVPYQSIDEHPTRFLFLLHRPTAHLLFLWQDKEKEDGGLETACTCESARLTVPKNQLHFLCYCFAHRRGVTIPGHFMSANRAASSAAALSGFAA